MDSSLLPPRAAIRVGAVCALLLALTISASSTASAASLAERQAKAAALEAEVSALEERYDGLQERARGARLELADLRRQTTRAQVRLTRTRSSLRAARSRMQERAVSMYKGESSSMLTNIVTAGSLSGVFERLDAVQRIGQQDADILAEVENLEQRIEQQEATLRRSRDAAQKTAAELERDTKQMGALVQQRQATLASANEDVRQMMEAQRQAAAQAAEAQSRERAAAITSGDTDTIDAGTQDDNDGSDSSDASSPDSSSNDGDSASGISIPLPPGSGTAAAAAGIAMGKVGAPYVWAAAGPDSFDCSGLVVWAFAQAGRPGLPHSTYSLIGMGVEVPLSQAQTGDLVFTNSSGHMGIYVGGGNMVHSPRTGRTVSVEPLTYYSVVAVRRI